MHQTIGRIAGKPSDYKKCVRCFAINWYENEVCVNCGYTFKTTNKFTEKDAEQLLKDFDDDEAEIDV